MSRFSKHSLRFIKKHPILFSIIFIITLICLYSLISNITSYYLFKTTNYDNITINDAVNIRKGTNSDIFVTLKDAHINCKNSTVFSSGRSRKLVTQIQDSNSQIFIIGLYSNPNCQNLLNKPVSGSLGHLPFQLYYTIRGLSFDFNGNYRSDIYLLCNYCDETNSLLGIIISLVGFLFFSWMLVYLIKQRN